MRKVANTINEAVTSIMNDVEDLSTKTHRGHVTAIVTALSVAYRLPLPSGPVERPAEWYLQQCLSVVESTIGGLLDYLALDVEETLKLVREAWLLRYRVLHHPFSEQALHAMLCVVNVADVELAPVYRDVVCKASEGVKRRAMMIIGDAMSNAGILPVEH